jgi:hypothetical protein
MQERLQPLQELVTTYVLTASEASIMCVKVLAADQDLENDDQLVPHFHLFLRPAASVL